VQENENGKIYTKSLSKTRFQHPSEKLHLHIQVFLRKMLGTRYGYVGAQFL